MTETARFDNIEKRLRLIETEAAVQALKDQTILGRLDKIDGHIARLVWLVLASIIGGLMTLLMNGTP